MRLLILLLLSPLLCFSQEAIPSSGPVSMSRIAAVQVALGEMSPLILDQPYTLAELNSYSHLSDKTPPFKISDWYGYTGNFRSSQMDTVVLRNNCGTGLIPSSGMYSIAEGAYTSTISVEHANELAKADLDANAQLAANGQPVSGLGTAYPGGCHSSSSTYNNISLVQVKRVDRFPRSDIVNVVFSSQYPVASNLIVTIRVWGIDNSYDDYDRILHAGTVTTSTHVGDSQNITLKNPYGQIIAVTPTSDSQYIYTF